MVQHVIDRPPVGGTRLKMSYDEWRSWEVEGVKSEWVDGEAIVFMPTTGRHWALLIFLAKLLTDYVDFLGLGRVVSDVEMRIGGRGRVPDILFVRSDQLGRLSETRLVGPADLVVELVSDDSVERDHKEKFAEYEAAGVAEYWAMDARPGKYGAEFYELAHDAFRPIPLDVDGRLRSKAVNGFWLRPEWLLNDPLPTALKCLAAIAPDALRAALSDPASADA